MDSNPEFQEERIPIKRRRPNPIFEDWLKDLYEEAREKKSKLESKLREAYESMLQYPLPLKTGADCAVLQGFDKNLCLFFDKRLEVYNSNRRRSLLSSQDKSSKPKKMKIPADSNETNPTEGKCTSSASENANSKEMKKPTEGNEAKPTEANNKNLASANANSKEMKKPTEGNEAKPTEANNKNLASANANSKEMKIPTEGSGTNSASANIDSKEFKKPTEGSGKNLACGILNLQDDLVSSTDTMDAEKKSK